METIATKSYSFEGADLILSSLLREVQNGIYIDVGANRPIIQNNTYYFYKIGWSGLALDGNDNFSEEWEKARPRDIFLQVLISDKSKEAKFNIFEDHTLSTMDEETIIRYKNKYEGQKAKTVSLTTSTLHQIKNKYLKNNEVHLVSIDIEGEDFNCLKGAMFDQWLPGVVLVETKNLSLHHLEESLIVNYMTKIGYRLIAKTPLDSFFIYPKKRYFSWLPESIIKF